MRDDSDFPDLPAAWTVGFNTCDPLDEGRREVVLAVGNGIFVSRAAALDAGRGGPHYPGTYRAGCYDRAPVDVNGVHDDIETLVNLPDWLPVAIAIDGGPPLCVERCELLDYFHGIDLKRGLMRRECLLRDGGGRTTRIRECRLVSMAHPHLAALRLEFTPLDWEGEVEFRSALDASVDNANVERFLDYPRRHLAAPRVTALPRGDLLLGTRTSDGGIRIAMALRTALDGACAAPAAVRKGERRGEHVFRTRAARGVAQVLDKTLALCTTLDEASGAPEERALQALAAADGFVPLRREHASRWRDLWRQAALEAGDEDMTRSLHLHAFHILQTISPHCAGHDTAIPARGWHGEGYHGHIFWDELFVAPFLALRFPELAKAPLLYRYRRLAAARRAARAAGLRGAMYPWRSAGDGSEVTPRQQKNLITGSWMPDHTRLQRHVGAAIAFNIWQYHLATGDAAFLAGHGAEMLLDIARFWSAIATFDQASGRYEIRGVIGPDEYHNAYPGRAAPGVDNNAYTNVMAVWTLCRALEALDMLPERTGRSLRDRLGIDGAELALWERISRAMYVPFHGDGILSQFSGFDALEEFHPAILPPSLADRRLDWALNAVGRSADQYRITKQADALTLFYLLPEREVIGLLRQLGYAFDEEAILRTARYYLSRTTHRSSLSRVVYAGALARLDPELSWQLYREALGTDLHPMKSQSVAEGIHLGAMGGTLDILQRRYLGVHPDRDGLRIDPALPPGIGGVRLGLRYRGSRLEVASAGAEVHVRSHPQNQDAVTLITAGGTARLTPGAELRVPARLAGGRF